jgi:hypothetical protein
MTARPSLAVIGVLKLAKFMSGVSNGTPGVNDPDKAHPFD